MSKLKFTSLIDIENYVEDHIDDRAEAEVEFLQEGGWVKKNGITISIWKAKPKIKLTYDIKFPYQTVGNQRTILMDEFVISLHEVIGDINKQIDAVMAAPIIGKTKEIPDTPHESTKSDTSRYDKYFKLSRRDSTLRQTSQTIRGN